jgi:hypothetical protein
MTIRFAATRNPLIAEPTMSLQFSEDDLLRELGAASVDKGELLWLDDRVRQVEVTAGGTRISGNVFGSRPYSQTIMLASNGRAITILQLSARSQLQACRGGAAPAFGTPTPRHGQRASRDRNGS